MENRRSKMDKNIFLNLSWNASLNSQNKAINELASVESLDPNELIQPISKEYWENAAKVLNMIGYPRVEAAISGLFSWLQDMNWPGAMIVMELLKSLPKDVIIPYLESATIDGDDEIWLINLSTFLIHLKLREHDFVSKKLYLTLLNATKY